MNDKIKIKKLKELVDNAYNNSNNGEAEVECWLQLEDDCVLYDIDSIGQFHVIPDMTITFKPRTNKIYSSNILTEEQLNYKEKYEELKNRLDKIRNLL